MHPLVDAAITLAPILAPITLGYLAWYASACWIKPFGTCSRCEGTGHTHTRGLLVAPKRRVCRTCRGTGLRLRTGRALANHLRRTYTAAHPTPITSRPGRRP